MICLVVLTCRRGRRVFAGLTQNVLAVDGASAVKRSVSVITAPAAMPCPASVSVYRAGLDAPALKVNTHTCTHRENVKTPRYIPRYLPR